LRFYTVALSWEKIYKFKKNPGVNKSPLNNREKAVIVDALKEKYPLPVLIKSSNWPRAAITIKTNVSVLQRSIEMIIKLLRPYFTTIRKDMDIVELK
jgi:putative transposase